MNKGKRAALAVFIPSIILCSLLLSSCKADQTLEKPYFETVEAGGQSITIIFDGDVFPEGTIKSENGEYGFQYQASPDGTEFTVTYPDGCVYSQKNANGIGTVTYGYDGREREAKGYIDMFSLEGAVEHAINNIKGSRTHNASVPVAAVLLIGYGAWNLFWPKAVWQFVRGWKYKKAEPSDLVLMLYRISGSILLAAGIVCLMAVLTA